MVYFNEYYDLTVRAVPNYGFLPIVFADNKEVFRGSFKKSVEEAFGEAVKVADTLTKAK